MKKTSLLLTIMITVFLLGCDQTPVYEKVTVEDYNNVYSYITETFSSLTTNMNNSVSSGSGWFHTDEGNGSESFTFDSFDLTQYDSITGLNLYDSISGKWSYIIDGTLQTVVSNFTFTGSGPVIVYSYQYVNDTADNTTTYLYIINEYDMTDAIRGQ